METMRLHATSVMCACMFVIFLIENRCASLATHAFSLQMCVNTQLFHHACVLKKGGKRVQRKLL